MNIINKILFIVGFTSLQAQAPLVPKEILFGNPEKNSPQISPDGKHLSYLAPSQENVLNVFIDGVQITSNTKNGITFYYWEYNSENILYLQDKDGDQNWHIYQTNIHTKETRDLTPFDNVLAHIVAYKHEFPHEILIGMNKRTPTLSDIYRLNLRTGSLELEMENTNNAFTWVADHQLNIRAALSYDKKGDSVLWIRDHNQAPWEELMRWTPLEEGEVIDFSPDNQSLYFLSNKHSNTSKLYSIDLKTREITTIAKDPMYDVNSVYVMRHPKTYKIEALGIIHEKLKWTLLDSGIEEDFATLQKGHEEIQIVSRDLDDTQWIIAHQSDQKPTWYSLYNKQTKQNTFLFSTQPKLEQYQFSKMQPISYHARDGMLIHGYLTLPVDKESKNLPTVLLVHGGPWARDTWKFDSFVQLLASRGYAVLQVNFRGSYGYGKEYTNAGNREWAGKMHTDLLDGKQWLIDKGYTNPELVAIAGHSYGGYAALVGLTFTPEEFCCGINIIGPSDVFTLLQTNPPHWAPFKPLFDHRVGILETEEEFLRSISPLYKADQIVRPLLIARGANDLHLKQDETDQIVETMRKNGQEVENLLFEEEGHVLMRLENNLKLYSAIEGFLHKHLGGRLEK